MGKMQQTAWSVKDTTHGQVDVCIVDDAEETIALDQNDGNVIWVALADLPALVEALHAAGKTIEARP